MVSLPPVGILNSLCSICDVCLLNYSVPTEHNIAKYIRHLNKFIIVIIIIITVIIIIIIINYGIQVKTGWPLWSTLGRPLVRMLKSRMPAQEPSWET